MTALIYLQSRFVYLIIDSSSECRNSYQCRYLTVSESTDSRVCDVIQIIIILNLLNMYVIVVHSFICFSIFYIECFHFQLLIAFVHNPLKHKTVSKSSDCPLFVTQICRCIISNSFKICCTSFQWYLQLLEFAILCQESYDALIGRLFHIESCFD